MGAVSVRFRIGRRRFHSGVRPAVLLWGAALVLSSLSTGFLGCSPGETSQLNPGTNRVGLDVLPDTLTALVPAADRSFRPLVATGGSTELFLSRSDQLESIAYLRFGLTDLPDTAQVDSAVLDLRFKAGPPGTFGLASYVVDPSQPAWTEEELLPPGLVLLEPPITERQGLTLPVEDDQLVEGITEVSGDLIRSWKSDPEVNKGLGIRLLEGGLPSVRFLSKEGTPDTNGTRVIQPVLKILLSDGSSIFDEPTDDAHVILDGRPAEGGADSSLLIEEQVASRALLRFDLTGQPLQSGDTVNRALLRLRIVPGSFATEDSFLVAVYEALDPWEEVTEPDSVSRSSALDVERISQDTETVELDIGSAVQRWLDSGSNLGVQIRAVTEAEGVHRVRFYSREALEGFRPELVIVYTGPPDPRWEGRAAGDGP